MTDGFGLYDDGGGIAKDAAAIRGVPISPGGDGLAVATLTAVQKLAATAGHRLALPPLQDAAANDSSSAAVWILFGLGLLVIALAWTVSLRLRPLELGRRSAAKTKRRRR
jgi:hypothetical protein